MINAHTGVPAWRQLAALLRARIDSGEWPPGTLLPSQPRLRHEYAIGKATLLKAMGDLLDAGLVDVEPGIGTRVRQPMALEQVAVPRGARIRSRMPTPEEREQWGLPHGVAVLVVTLGGHVRGRYPADRIELTTA